MSTINATTNRDGFALPVALLAILVIGAIVTGGFYASSQESRVSMSADLGNQAFYVAEYGLEEALGTWKNDVLAGVTATKAFSPVDVYAGGELLGSYTLSARRIGQYLFLVTSEGRVTAGPRQAVRRVGSMVRTLKIDTPIPTALAVYGRLTSTGNSTIRGEDNGGPGCTAGDAVPGVLATSDTMVVREGNAAEISGDPPIDSNPYLTPEMMAEFGAVNLQDLINSATHRYEADAELTQMEPSTTTDPYGNEVCDETDQLNWGDPSGTGPCSSHMPIIYGEGDLHVKVGTGQGVMIVEGDLYAAGNYDFYGLVIVKGNLYIEGVGNHIEGSVLIMGEGSLESESVSAGKSLVQYSQCRIDRAFNASLRPRPLASRSWMDFTAVTRGEAVP